MELLKDQTGSSGVVIFCVEQAWSAPHNVARALFKEGAQVTIVAPKDSFVAHTKYANYSILYNRIELKNVMHSALNQICKTIQPKIVLPGDDPAFRWLHHLRQLEGVDPDVAALLSRSLPNFSKAETIVSDSDFIVHYSRFPCRPPPFLKSPSWIDVLSFIEENHLPIVFKKDGLWSGHGIKVCQSAQTAREAFDSLSGGSFLVTKFIKGTPAAVAVSGLAGRVCRAFCYKKIEQVMENGPSSVVEHIQHEAMLSTARNIFEVGELSGFCGIDFVIDEDDRAWLLELNPRMTPATHLGKYFGEDTIKDFIAALNGAKTLSVNKKILDRVALFPAEISRDSNSPYFYNTFHDVPWDDPKVLMHIISNPTVLR